MKMIRSSILLLLTICLTLGISSKTNIANAVEENEEAIIVLGAQLSDSQKEEVRKLFGVTDQDNVKEHIITGQDIANYIDGNPDSNMYSSAKIIRREEGYGIRIEIATPENITKVTSDMYANAMLTAGVENASVVVA